MRLDDAKVILGDKIYRVLGVNWEQTIEDYPRIEVDAYIGPRYCVGKYKSHILRQIWIDCRNISKRL